MAKKKKKKGHKGNGLGHITHHSPMARGTRTKSREGRRRKRDRQRKQEGWR